MQYSQNSQIELWTRISMFCRDRHKFENFILTNVCQSFVNRRLLYNSSISSIHHAFSEQVIVHCLRQMKICVWEHSMVWGRYSSQDKATCNCRLCIGVLLVGRYEKIFCPLQGVVPPALQCHLTSEINLRYAMLFATMYKYNHNDNLSVNHKAHKPS